MFEFGRDLRKLFAQARESDDLGWIELIGADLVRGEARQQSIDAGRVSCTHPFDAGLRACALWREHARRTGFGDSLDRARKAASEAVRTAAGADQAARAAIETAHVLMLEFDLNGGVAALTRAVAGIDALGRVNRPETARAAAVIHARLKARQARLSSDNAALLDATALLDAALHDLGPRAGAAADEARLDRAALALEAGVARCDARLLDQAGRDLRDLVEQAAPEYRPLTRARALALCGVGMKLLAAMAGDAAVMRQGQAMFEAAADQFTVDHSPLDWVAIQIVRADDRASLVALAQAQVLTEGGGLILGALAREARFALETAAAESAADLKTLSALRARLCRRLGDRSGRQTPLDWAADQIAIARVNIALGRLTGLEAVCLDMTLVEAAATARELGVTALAARAEGLIAGRAVRV
ncbi:hypothetical protein [Brevundimonas sp.]|uniref:hypothetical protein n=1 Tax=Brevundimonas sp. TaxID=1871086 RepID=UPI0024880FC0|nr:hypothetical protein [Brevundimonas sp.]MDI1281228.1 hypothetical protein [Brevundimonas sp.]